MNGHLVTKRGHRLEAWKAFWSPQPPGECTLAETPFLFCGGSGSGIRGPGGGRLLRWARRGWWSLVVGCRDGGAVLVEAACL